MIDMQRDYFGEAHDTWLVTWIYYVFSTFAFTIVMMIFDGTIIFEIAKILWAFGMVFFLIRIARLLLNGLLQSIFFKLNIQKKNSKIS